VCVCVCVHVCVCVCVCACVCVCVAPVRRHQEGSHMDAGEVLSGVVQARGG